MRTICCVCQKTKVQDGWEKKRVTKNIRVSHGYCPGCYQQTMTEVEAYLASRCEASVAFG